MMKKKVLFVCVHNSARSQMAEGILRHLYGKDYEACSAGSAPTIIHPLAVEAMGEIGIDISLQKSKGLDELKGIRFDLAVTLCGAAAPCPFVPNAVSAIHKEFDDPAGTSDMNMFRRVRDEILIWITDAFKDPDRMKEMQQTPVRLL